MAQVQLDKDVTLDLLDDEEVIYFCPRVSRKDGFMKMSVFVFIITDKRIALVPDPKWNKKSKTTETLQYTDYLYAQSGKDPDSAFSQFLLVMKEKEKLLGFIPVHKKQMFQVSAGAKEALGLLGKEFASGIKDIAMNMAQSAENQQIYQDSKNQGEYDERYKKMTAEWQQIRAKANASAAEANKKAKLTPYDRRNIIVGLLNDAIKLAGN